jgi:hypothetical protein
MQQILSWIISEPYRIIGLVAAIFGLVFLVLAVMQCRMVGGYRTFLNPKSRPALKEVFKEMNIPEEGVNFLMKRPLAWLLEGIFLLLLGLFLEGLGWIFLIGIR